MASVQLTLETWFFKKAPIFQKDLNVFLAAFMISDLLRSKFAPKLSLSQF